MTEPLLPLDTPDKDAPTGVRGRAPVLAAVAAVTVLAVAGALTLLGSDTTEDDGVLFPPRSAVLAGADAGAEASVDGTRLPASSDLGAGRDPFAPLYVAPVSAPGSSGATDTGVPSSPAEALPTSGPFPTPPFPTGPSPTGPFPPPPTQPLQPTRPGPQPTDPAPTGPTEPAPPRSSPQPTTPQPAPTAPVQTITVSLEQVRVAPGGSDQVDDGQADLLVDGTPTTVTVGQVFATAFRLVSVQEGPEGRCATLQYGEELFDLCEGDPAVVR